MRTLTIKRTKSFVACLVTMKVYIEDHSSNEIVINDIPCRKLGQLKNGEEKTFEIDNEAAKVFVIADKLSKNYCNDFYEIPYGEDDISLTGKNQFNIATGNAFRFDNNPSQAALSNRTRGTNKGAVVTIIALVVGAIIGAIIGFMMMQ